MVRMVRNGSNGSVPRRPNLSTLGRTAARSGGAAGRTAGPATALSHRTSRLLILGLLEGLLVRLIPGVPGGSVINLIKLYKACSRMYRSHILQVNTTVVVPM